jgi:hypothetical protein
MRELVGSLLWRGVVCVAGKWVHPPAIMTQPHCTIPLVRSKHLRSWLTNSWIEFAGSVNNEI